MDTLRKKCLYFTKLFNGIKYLFTDDRAMNSFNEKSQSDKQTIRETLPSVKKEIIALLDSKDFERVIKPIYQSIYDMNRNLTTLTKKLKKSEKNLKRNQDMIAKINNTVEITESEVERDDDEPYDPTAPIYYQYSDINLKGGQKHTIKKRSIKNKKYKNNQQKRRTTKRRRLIYSLKEN